MESQRSSSYTPPIQAMYSNTRFHEEEPLTTHSFRMGSTPDGVGIRCKTAVGRYSFVRRKNENQQKILDFDGSGYPGFRCNFFLPEDPPLAGREKVTWGSIHGCKSINIRGKIIRGHIQPRLDLR